MALFKRKQKPAEKTLRDVALDEYSVATKERDLTDPKYKIGHGKGVSVGNFRLYKVRMGTGKDKEENLVVSGIQQGWRVHIPDTVPQYQMIQSLYADYVDGSQMGLNMYLSNMINVSLNIRADYHYLINCIAQIYANPNGTVKKGDKTYTIIDAVANDVKWIGENVQMEYARDKEAEEMSKAAKDQLDKDEVFHSMIDDAENLEKKEAIDDAEVKEKS